MSSTSNTKKRQRSSSPPTLAYSHKQDKEHNHPESDRAEEEEECTTDTKLAILLSLHPTIDLSTVLDTLIASDGSVSAASSALQCIDTFTPTSVSTSTSPHLRKKHAPVNHQTSLTGFLKYSPEIHQKIPIPLKGETIHLYTPFSVSAVTPTTLIPSFLPPSLATSLLKELLVETATFDIPPKFRLFDRNVQSPHTNGFFLRDGDGGEDGGRDRKGYHSYQARQLKPRRFTPSMLTATEMVEDSVNSEIAARHRAKDWPWGMSKDRWETNAALVNRYSGARESVGWHADELSYLGPMTTIASLSLGVEREFRVRRVVRDNGNGDEDGQHSGKEKENEGEGAFSIHLPHNSLLIMHAGMQEGWKHCIHPARKVDLHPLAGDVRINLTYRCYRNSLLPETIPKCQCNLTTTLRPVFGKDPEDPESPRKYFWKCAGIYNPDGDGKGCGFFQWAEFDRFGELLKRPQ